MMRRAIAACAIGNATEWFDYSTYGFLARLTREESLKPSSKPVARTTRRRSSWAQGIVTTTLWFCRGVGDRDPLGERGRHRGAVRGS